jgi:hypothetical protein
VTPDEHVPNGGDAHDGEELRDGEAVAHFAHESLRDNLHRAIDGVLAVRFQDQRVREVLAAELFGAIDPIVRDYALANYIGRLVPPVGASAGSAAPRSIEDAMSALRTKLQSAFAEREPGARESRSGMRERASNAMSLAPSVVDSLSTFVHDGAAFERAQEAASVVMSRYMHPYFARQVVSMAAAAVRGAARAGSEDASAPVEEGQAMRPKAVPEADLPPDRT